MRCLVTGATGSIGGVILQGLHEAGHEVVAYVREGSDSSSLAEFKRVVGDLSDPNRLAVAAEGCDAMIHAAGTSNHRADPETLGWTHVAGTENAINAAKKAGCERLVYVSCADVTLYDGPRSFWNEDEAPMRPFGRHALSKLHAEDLVRVSGSNGLRTIVLRPALVWGPGELTNMSQWIEEANSGGIRLVAGGKKIMSTTYTTNLLHAVHRATLADVPSGSVYYVVDTELGLSRDFFAELSVALGWAKPRGGGPYFWEKLRARLRLSPLHPSQVIIRGQTSAFEMNRAKTELGYEPLVAREDGLTELASWWGEIRRSASQFLQERQSQG